MPILNDNLAGTVTVCADGEANFWTLLIPDKRHSAGHPNWLARIQFNGELWHRHQEQLLEQMVQAINEGDAPAAEATVMDADRAARLIAHLESGVKRAERRVLGATRSRNNAYSRDDDEQVVADGMTQDALDFANAELSDAAIALAIARDLVAGVVR